MSESSTGVPCSRILVVFACFGFKQLELLKRIITEYRKFPWKIDFVVVSEAPKEIGNDVEVIVGLPSKNPWTLPFAHKQVFADRLNEYDLFIYSEDDIAITYDNIAAFLEITPTLKDDEIAGFLRYEYDPNKVMFLDEPWAHYHWKPDSVRRRGRFTIAEFTNEHAGFYILTRAQLKRAIESGGFLRGPCRGRYNWPETAATDPYTVCGFRKVICISEIERFLVHHASNKYVHQLDVTFNQFKVQLEALKEICEGRHVASTLCLIESSKLPGYWQKSYYEKPIFDLLSSVPAKAQTVLSVGCGWARTECHLLESGKAVTAIPLDSVIGKVAEQKGVEVVYGDLKGAFSSLRGKTFDCVILSNILHLQDQPFEFLTRAAEAVAMGGVLVVVGPNFQRLPWRFKRVFGLGDYGKLRTYEDCGMHRIEPSRVAQSLEKLGFETAQIIWSDHEAHDPPFNKLRVALGSHTARTWVYKAKRKGAVGSGYVRAVADSVR